MNWIMGLQRAIDYIEDHLDEPLDYDEIARQAYSSSFHFQRVFSILCGYTLGEYIRSRRLTLAGNELAVSGCRVIDVAVKYGYDSPESFSRAFVKFHHILPSQARIMSAKLRSFSRLSVKLTLEGGTIMDYRVEKRDTIPVLVKKWRFPGGAEFDSKMISDTWNATTQDHTLDAMCRCMDPKPFGGAVLGICFENPSSGDFDYAIGVAYDGHSEPPAGTTVAQIPAATWIAFPGRGAMPDAFGTLMKSIYTEYFPTSSYQPTDGAYLEVYFDANVTNENYTFESWIPVTQKED